MQCFLSQVEGSKPVHLLKRNYIRRSFLRYFMIFFKTFSLYNILVQPRFSLDGKETTKMGLKDILYQKMKCYQVSSTRSLYFLTKYTFLITYMSPHQPMSNFIVPKCQITYSLHESITEGSIATYFYQRKR